MKTASLANSAVVIWFMALIVVGTVVVYFLFLPKIAPKQITIAVMPFHTATKVEPFLLNSLAREISERLEYSRDLTTVDFDSGVEVAKLRQEMRSFTTELGASHLLVGSIEQFGGETLEITSVLVNISHPAMKEVWTNTYSVLDGNFVPVPRQVASEVREALYDRAAEGSPRKPEMGREAYLFYLQALYALQESNIAEAERWIADSVSAEPNSPALVLAARLAAPAERASLLRQALELSSEYLPALIEFSRVRFERDKDVVGYHEEVVRLAKRYPNSDALLWLVELYEALGLYKEAVELRYRVVRSRPRNPCVAAELAISRFRIGDIDELEPLLELASQRGAQNSCALRYLNLYQFERGSEPSQSSENPLIHVIRAGQEQAWDAFEELVGLIPDVDGQILARLYAGRVEPIFELLPLSDRLWVGPPLWWKHTDPRWTKLNSDTRYVTYLEEIGFGEQQSERIRPVDPRELLVPKRMETDS